MMKIDDCQNVAEFFGVKHGDSIWVDGAKYMVLVHCLRGGKTSLKQDGQALVGCLTGQLDWSKEPPKLQPNEEETAILREVAKWFEKWDMLFLDSNDALKCSNSKYYDDWPGVLSSDRQYYAYRVLVPIIKKYGKIDLRKYREDKEQ